jgi:hypothetical protein
MRGVFEGETGWPEPPDASVVGTPERTPRSVRRTAHINMAWPEGLTGLLELRGRARDLLTPATGDPVVVAEAAMVTTVGPGRMVEGIATWPARQRIGELVGARGGTTFRSAIDDALPGERETATPLYFLLDDIAGCSLIAGSAWLRAERTGSFQRPPVPEGAFPEALGIRKGKIICSGLRPGGYAQQPGRLAEQFSRQAGDLASRDPWAWHEIDPLTAPSMRRRRRVDVRLDGDVIDVDAHFRDSFWEEGDPEMALHEYTLRASVDRASHRVITIAATPRALPFPECPAAAPHVTQLVGMPVGGLRTSVQATLQALECCTHLNDMLRCLAEVHALEQHLEQDPVGG